MIRDGRRTAAAWRLHVAWTRSLSDDVWRFVRGSERVARTHGRVRKLMRESGV